MEFQTAFDYWSIMHCLGSFVLTLALGTLNFNLQPVPVGGFVFVMGASWELVIDEELRLNDVRGGDYYDMAWDFAGAAAGIAVLNAAHKHKNRYTNKLYGYDQKEPLPEKSVVNNNHLKLDFDRLGLNNIQFTNRCSFPLDSCLETTYFISHQDSISCLMECDAIAEPSKSAKPWWITRQVSLN